jgi:hypothetical protein
MNDVSTVMCISLRTATSASDRVCTLRDRDDQSVVALCPAVNINPEGDPVTLE